MANTTPSPEELEALSVTPGMKSVEEKVPDPSPEIVERAQKLVDEIASGKNLSSHGEGPAAGGREIVDPVKDLTDNDKLRFMAHILGNTPFERVYSMLGGKFEVTFTSLTAPADKALKQLVYKEKDTRKRVRLYNDYAMFCMLTTLKIDGECVEVALDPTSEGFTFTESYNALVKDLNQLQYRLISEKYNQYVTEIDTLLKRVDDPNFWPTPS